MSDMAQLISVDSEDDDEDTEDDPDYEPLLMEDDSIEPREMVWRSMMSSLQACQGLPSFFKGFSMVWPADMVRQISLASCYGQGRLCSAVKQADVTGWCRQPFSLDSRKVAVIRIRVVL